MLQVEVKAVFVLKSKEKQCGTDQVTGRGKSSVCVTGGELEASEGASQASGGSKQPAHSTNHTSSSLAGGGINPPAASQKALQSGAGGDQGGQGDQGGLRGSVQTSCSQSGSISALSTCDSATGL